MVGVSITFSAINRDAINSSPALLLTISLVFFGRPLFLVELSLTVSSADVSFFGLPHCPFNSIK